MMNYFIDIGVKDETSEYGHNGFDDIKVIYVYRLCHTDYDGGTRIEDSGRFDLYLGVF